MQGGIGQRPDAGKMVDVDVIDPRRTRLPSRLGAMSFGWIGGSVGQAFFLVEMTIFSWLLAARLAYRSPRNHCILLSAVLR